MSIIQIAHNATTAKVKDPSRDVAIQIQEILSYSVDGAEHMDSVKNHKWDGRSSFYQFADHTFPRGFIALVNARLKKLGHTVQILKKPFPEPLGPINPVVDAFPAHPRYDYQPEVVRKLEFHGQIIAQVATGGGKSRIAKLATARLGRKTLFLTTRGVLMHQMHASFKELNPDAALLGDGIIEDGPIVCGMVQTIMAHLNANTYAQEIKRLADALATKEEKQKEALLAKMKKAKLTPIVQAAELAKLDREQEKSRPSEAEFIATAKANVITQAERRKKMIALLRTFEFVILEEAHEASGNSYFDILGQCVNAHYRLALTGTPFMKESEEQNMRLMAASGHVAIRVTEEMLIERGILATPRFKFVKLPVKPPKLYKSTSWRAAYDYGVVNNEYRNKAGIAEIIRAIRYGLTALALVQSREHGNIIKKMLEKYGVRAEYIQGEDNQKERQRCLGMLKRGEISVLIGSTILDVGVDVPAIGIVVNFGGGKAEVALRQRIGRGLREKRSGPNIMYYVDFEDDYNNHLREHFAQRLAIIKGTAGFNQHVVEDFNLAADGFVKLVA
ncbi:helicase-related protein [Methylobacillus sp.]|uniref:DEAD/DEAH box helicase n=1 Tax=Methylobacillus sp. TaxID=56818 RepID=UPI0012CC3988|nr:helicase-related protein [Methylobacillus sp.]MPS48533.1 ATP-dependent helicase [Methylobacillus sp.]